MWVGGVEIGPFELDFLRPVAIFGLTNIDPIFPVDKATLRVYVDAFGGGGSPADLTAFELLKYWAEDAVTWDNRTSDMPWGTPGGDYAETLAGSLEITSNDVGTWAELDITALVQKWVADPAANRGLLLRLMNATSYTKYRLASSEYWNPALVPHIEVTYRTP
jgi:hypothetical protein